MAILPTVAPIPSNVKGQQREMRNRRFSQQVANALNGLTRTGQVGQTGPTTWEIQIQQEILWRISLRA